MKGMGRRIMILISREPGSAKGGNRHNVFRAVRSTAEFLCTHSDCPYYYSLLFDLIQVSRV